MAEGTRGHEKYILEGTVKQLKESSDKQAATLSELSKMVAATNLKFEHMTSRIEESSGTCKGLQMQRTNSSRCHRAYGSTQMARVKESHGRDNMDVTCEIHRMEMEAYNAVLRAFIAQSSVLSWSKEGLITELRKELNVTDIEHRELLMKIDSNESIRMIREWRKGTSYAQEPPPSKMNTAGIVPSSERYAAQKKLKTSHTSVPMSQKYISHGQPSSPADPASVPAKLKDGENHRELVVFSSGNAGLPMNAVGHKIQAPSSIKGRATGASQTKMAFHAPDGGNFKKRYDLIEIRETDKLIQEIIKRLIKLAPLGCRIYVVIIWVLMDCIT
uniref:ENT domain-containing protein n=1 Tax=Vitis vinifera TaxID=29760 RepID=A5BMK3_VITVI|nr:hypothetical protein VITISV_016508 [Vitis vinifera]